MSCFFRQQGMISWQTRIEGGHALIERPSRACERSCRFPAAAQSAQSTAMNRRSSASTHPAFWSCRESSTFTEMAFETADDAAPRGRLSARCRIFRKAIDRPWPTASPTVFHGVTWSWEPGLRGAENARARSSGASRTLRPRLGADTRVHLRHEDLQSRRRARDHRLGWPSAVIDIIAFNDHMPPADETSSRAQKAHAADDRALRGDARASRRGGSSA